MSRSEQISKLLKSITSSSPDVEAAAIVDNDGLMIASALPGDTEDDRVAAMSAALLGMSERISRELSRGDFQLVMIRGTDGFTVLMRCGPDAVLSVLAAPTAKLGLIFLDTTRGAKEIARLIR
ncbi:MAG: roadblock/LC7 domain-containing protein [Nannocystaceae bacterium]|mgnify:CR=1 FL=1